MDLPTHMETERLILRSYQAGDGAWYYVMSQRNKTHLARYESGNAVMTINTEEEAERVVGDFAASWAAGDAFFLGVFRRDTREFVAQIYIGAANRELPEFEIGFFADVEHEGQGYVAEATRGALRFIFEQLGAHRVRLRCDDTNAPSRRVAERCGMVREGHIRENKKNADGSISGTLHYGLLRSEFVRSETLSKARRQNDMPDSTLFLYKIQPVRPDMLSVGPTPEEGETISQHFDYLQGLTEAGVVLLAGRTLNTDHSSFGIVILRAGSEEEARRIMVDDPAVKRRVMRAELYPYRIALLGTLPRP